MSSNVFDSYDSSYNCRGHIMTQRGVLIKVEFNNILDLGLGETIVDSVKCEGKYISIFHNTGLDFLESLDLKIHEFGDYVSFEEQRTVKLLAL